jgi:hypothetical protein
MGLTRPVATIAGDAFDQEDGRSIAIQSIRNRL